MSSCPPIRRNRVCPPNSIKPAKIVPSASASRKAWNTSALARSGLPAPTARATAEETPAPIPLLVDCRTSITQGKTSEAPASASDPSFPRKNPSKVTMPVNAIRLRIFGADSLSSVGKIGPSSSRLVRAAAYACAGLAEAGSDVEMVAICSLTKRSFPARGVRSSAWTTRLLEAGRLLGEPDRSMKQKAISTHCNYLQRIFSQTCLRKSHELLRPICCCCHRYPIFLIRFPHERLRHGAPSPTAEWPESVRGCGTERKLHARRRGVECHAGRRQPSGESARG